MFQVEAKNNREMIVNSLNVQKQNSCCSRQKVETWTSKTIKCNNIFVMKIETRKSRLIHYWVFALSVIGALIISTEVLTNFVIKFLAPRLVGRKTVFTQSRNKQTKNRISGVNSYNERVMDLIYDSLFVFCFKRAKSTCNQSNDSVDMIKKFFFHQVARRLIDRQNAFIFSESWKFSF